MTLSQQDRFNVLALFVGAHGFPQTQADWQAIVNAVAFIDDTTAFANNIADLEARAAKDAEETGA